ncbi:aldo/keto reductase [Yinghuangia aomiensis]
MSTASASTRRISRIRCSAWTRRCGGSPNSSTRVVAEVGVSNYDLARWRRAEQALGRRVLSDQVEFSLVHPGPLDDLVPWAERNGRIVIAYSPLAQGLLGCRYDAYNPPSGFRARGALFRPANLRRARPLLELLQEVAAAHDATPAQIALAWSCTAARSSRSPAPPPWSSSNGSAAAAEIELAADEYTALTDQARAFRPEHGRLGQLAPRPSRHNPRIE